MDTPKFLLQIGSDVENNAIFVTQDQKQVTTDVSKALKLQIYEIRYDATTEIVTLIIDTNIGNKLSGNPIEGYSVQVEGVKDFATWDVTVPELLLWRLAENKYLRFDFLNRRFFFNDNFIRRAGDDVVPGKDMVTFVGKTESDGLTSESGGMSHSHSNEGVPIKSGDEILFPQPMLVIQKMVVTYWRTFDTLPRREDFFDWTKDSDVNPMRRVADSDLMYDTVIVPEDLQVRVQFYKPTPVQLLVAPPEDGDEDEGEEEEKEDEEEQDQEPTTKKSKGLSTTAITLIVVFSVLVTAGISVAIWQGTRKRR